jgi:hypothetical protein
MAWDRGATNPEIPSAQLEIFPGGAGDYVFGTECGSYGKNCFGSLPRCIWVWTAQIHKETEEAAQDFSPVSES